jgi:hypothetical protein
MNWLNPLTKLFKKKSEKKTAVILPVDEEKRKREESIISQVVKEEEPKELKYSGRRKLNSDQVMKVCFWIASFEKVPDIVEKVKNEFGITISTYLIHWYKQHDNYKQIISKMREKWGNELEDLELTHKRKRIEKVSQIFDKCVDKGQMRNALSAITQIQGEVEKNQNIGSQTNYQINIYKDLTDRELEEERLKSIERLKILKQIPEIKAEENKDA